MDQYLAWDMRRTAQRCDPLKEVVVAAAPDGTFPAQRRTWFVQAMNRGPKLTIERTGPIVFSPDMLWGAGGPLLKVVKRRGDEISGMRPR